MVGVSQATVRNWLLVEAEESEEKEMQRNEGENFGDIDRLIEIKYPW